MKKTIALFMFVILSITLISGCSSEGRFNASNSNASSVSNSTSEGQYNSTTSPDTHSDITSKDNNSSTSKTQKQNPNTTRKTKPALKNNPKLIKSEIVKKTIKKTYSEFNNKPKIEMLKVFSNLNQNNVTLLATAEYKSYLEKEEEFTLKLCISNPERDTIVDVLLNDTQEGENCLYSSSSTVFKISSIDTLWDKTAQTYYTYVSLNIPVCKSAGKRSIEILEINFLRKIINDKINGNVELASKTASNFDVMCLKADNSIAVQNIISTGTSISFSLNINDVDKSISDISISLYNKSVLVEKKTNITDYSSIVFESLEAGTDYSVVVDSIYNRNSAVGEQTRTISNNIKTNLKGSGTEADPYQITKISDWEVMINSDNKNKHYKLMNDLDCNYDELLKSSVIKPFNGIFDGNNKTISNLKIDNSTMLKQCYALFQSNNGTIKNIIVKNIQIDLISQTYPSFGAGICGVNEGVIQNCITSGTIHIKLEKDYGDGLFVGKIVGRNGLNGAIIDCSSTIEIIN